MATLRNTIQSLADHTTFWRIVLVISTLAILFLATTSSPYPIPASASDKINHILAFAYLAVVARLAWPALSGLWLLPALMAYGLGIEIIQAFLPHRDFSLADLAADLIGCAIGLLPCPRFLNVRSLSQSRRHQSDAS